MLVPFVCASQESWYVHCLWYDPPQAVTVKECNDYFNMTHVTYRHRLCYLIKIQLRTELFWIMPGLPRRAQSSSTSWWKPEIMQDSVSKPFYKLWLCYKKNEGTRNIYKPDTTQLTLAPPKLSHWCRPIPVKDGSTAYTKLHFQPTELRYKCLEGHLKRHLISMPCYETAESSPNLHTKFLLISCPICASQKISSLSIFQPKFCIHLSSHRDACCSFYKLSLI